MNHKDKLLEIYSNSFTIEDINLPSSIKPYVDYICNSIEKQRGVYTVLLTLGIHKLLHPSQDIRLHQDNMTNGFSGRSVDTKYITPTLKELKLPSMSESGWLTRSLEQPYPYDLSYNGKVGNKNVKTSFLKIVEFFENWSTFDITNVLRVILNHGIKIREKNKIVIQPIKNPDRITIDNVIKILDYFIHSNYKTSGGSKIPVICFYTIYQILMNELKRFDECELHDLGSHTSCDRTSKSSGDIEIFKDGELFESLEIKYEIEIDLHIVNRVTEKILKYNPQRYYILSTLNIKEDDYSEIISRINQLKDEHGCQLIINGLLPTLKYYLRLISDLNLFISLLTTNLFEDTELKLVHKEKWSEILGEL